MRDNAVCDADDGDGGCKDVGEKGAGCDRTVLANFLAGEEEQPLEGQFNLDFNLLFNTVNGALLDTPLCPGGWHHAGVCENIVIRPRASWRGK